MRETPIKGGVMDFRITKVERLAATEPIIALALGGVPVGGSKAGVAATIETTIDPGSSGGTALADGATLQLGVSKLEGESEWIIDSFGKLGQFPWWANGIGSRCTMLKALSDAAMVAALDEAAGELAVAA